MPSTSTAGGTRERLVDAAAEAFAAEGFDAVTLDDIARRAGVHRVTLHRIFPGGRQEVVLAAAQRHVVALRGEVSAAIASAPDAEHALVEALTICYRRFRSNQAVVEMLGDPEMLSALLGASGAELQAMGLELWTLVRERAQAEGRAVTEASDRQVVEHVVRIGVSLVVSPGSVRTPAQLRAYVRMFVAPALLR